MLERTIIEVLAKEIQQLNWKVEYETKRADKAEAELKEAQAKIEDLTF